MSLSPHTSHLFLRFFPGRSVMTAGNKSTGVQRLAHPIWFILPPFLSIKKSSRLVLLLFHLPSPPHQMAIIQYPVVHFAQSLVYLVSTVAPGDSVPGACYSRNPFPKLRLLNLSHRMVNLMHILWADRVLSARPWVEAVGSRSHLLPMQVIGYLVAKRHLSSTWSEKRPRHAFVVPTPLYAMEVSVSSSSVVSDTNSFTSRVPVSFLPWAGAHVYGEKSFPPIDFLESRYPYLLYIYLLTVFVSWFYLCSYHLVTTHTLLIFVCLSWFCIGYIVFVGGQCCIAILLFVIHTYYYKVDQLSANTLRNLAMQGGGRT